MKVFKLLSAGAVAFTFMARPIAADEAAVDAMKGYMEFATYDAGIIQPQQITREIFDSVLFVDTRDAGQYSKETIPGAINIEWREVLNRLDEIPEDKKVILFCNTGDLSAQATFALRVAGRENVVVLQSGLNGWKQNAAYKP
ncbi:MAG: rhodanese-like domain-containing protein [Rhodospirillales bacterium]